MEDSSIINPLIKGEYEIISRNDRSNTVTSDEKRKKRETRRRDSVSVRTNLIHNHKRLNDRGVNEVMIMEIDDNGNDKISTLSLRDLLLYVDMMSSVIDSNLESASGSKLEMVSCLQHRDLRRLDFHYNAEEEPIVIVRRHAVLIAFDPLRAIIMSQRIIIIVPPGADTLLSKLKENMNEWCQNKKLNEEGVSRSKRSSSIGSDNDDTFLLPFESHAYEVIIATVYSLQLQEYEHMNSQIMKLLRHFNYAIVSIQVQETMRLLKNKVMQTIGKIHTFRRALGDLLENDEDLALMNLTRLKEKPSLYNIPLDPALLASHEEIEILLESYLTDYNSLETKLVYLKTQMQNAEELVMLRLDTSRNQLLIADNVISIVSCSLGFGSFIGALFGMNFDSDIWSDRTAFTSVTLITVFGMLIGAFGTIIYFQRTGILPSSQSKMPITRLHL